MYIKFIPETINMLDSIINNFENVLSEVRNVVPVTNPYVCTVCSTSHDDEGKCVYDVLHEITPFPTVIIEMICVLKKESDDSDMVISRQRNLMSQCLKYLPIACVDKEINSRINNIMSGNISMYFLITRFHKLKNCDCCSRHQFRKPFDLTDNSHTSNITVSEKERKCKCTCRHNSRIISDCFLDNFV